MFDFGQQRSFQSYRGPGLNELVLHGLGVDHGRYQRRTVIASRAREANRSAS